MHGENLKLIFFFVYSSKLRVGEAPCVHKFNPRLKKKSLVSYCTPFNRYKKQPASECMAELVGFKRVSGEAVAYPGILFGEGGVSTSSVEDRGQRERGSGGSSPLVKGSGGSCILVQKISFHVVTFS